MSRMSGILILSYRLKKVINSYVLYNCFWRIVHISRTRWLIEMGFRSKCSILNEQVIYIEKSKLEIADMWLIPLDRASIYYPFKSCKIEFIAQLSWLMINSGGLNLALFEWSNIVLLYLIDADLFLNYWQLQMLMGSVLLLSILFYNYLFLLHPPWGS